MQPPPAVAISPLTAAASAAAAFAPAQAGSQTSSTDFNTQLDQAVEENAPEPSSEPAPATRPTPSRKRDPEPSSNRRETKTSGNTTAAAPVAVSLTPDLPEANTAGQPKQTAGQINATTANGQPAEAAPLPVVAPPPANANNGIDAPLSFAAKIQTAPDQQADSGTQRMVLNDSVGAVAAAWKKGQQREEQQPEPDGAPAPANTPETPALNAIETVAAAANPLASSPAPKPAEAVPSPTKALDAPAPIQQHETPSTGQLKDVSFRIAQEDGSSVQLRLTQQSGELKLAVHSASPDLNQGLRDSLPDLTKRLSDGGFHTETWRPGVSAAPASAQGEAARNPGGNAQGGNSQNQAGSGQQGSSRRHQDQSGRPQWVEELENGIQSASSLPLTGELHGFVS